MMEVKQNTAVDLNDLLAPVKNSDGADEVDDVVMTDLTEESHDLNCDIMKANEKSNNGLVTNGDETLSSLIDLDSTNVALDTSVNAELEDALLAEDDVLPKLDDVKENNITASTSDVVEDILADKVETSNSTTSSNNVRDPGDDLDTLLSKINDIVEDCLDKEITDPTAEDDSVVEQSEEDGVVEQPEEDSVVEQPGEDNVAEQPEVEDNANIPVAASVATTDPKDESVILLDDTVAESSCLENDIADESDVHKVDESNEIPLPEEEEETDIEGDKDKIDERDVATPDLDKFPEDFITTESEKMSKTVPDTTTLTEKVSVENSATETDTPLEDVLPEKDTTDGDTIPPVDADTDIKEKTEEDSEEVKITQIEEENNVLEDDKVDDSPKLDDEKNNEDELLDENSTNKDVKPGSSTENDAQLLKKESASLDIEEETKESEQLSKGDEQLSKEDEHKVEKPETTSEKSTSENDQIKDSTETKIVPDDVQNRTNEQTEKVEHEDSDDEIVFYVDKPPETEKDKKSTGDDNEMSTASSSKAVDEKPQEVNEDKPSAEEDDVVILDDDDEMQGNKKLADSSHTEDTPSVEKTSAEEKDNEKSSSAEKTAEEAAAKADRKHSTIDIDNSDNARDDFVVSEKASDETKKSHEPEESNSNCSSSSNLLLEAKQVENAADEPTPEDNDNENEEEDDDGDVELIETESKEADLSEKGDDGSEIVPPAKRPRLSEDSEISSKTDETSKSRRTSESAEKKSEVAEDVSTTPASAATSLKRTHDVIELEIDDDKSNDSKSSLSTETVNKKAKTEELSSKEDDIKAQTETDEEKFIKSDIDSKTETNKDIVKMVPSEIPIPLYPPPKLKNLSPEESISLGFMKKFRKTFDKMTKQDLEELVLQKVVEAIIHRSEFAEMRELIEKQEKLITSHRSKISELSKQFRDLEMVHNRVVKDIEQRNSQFIMPVKITRAVGLQVYIPNKKSVLESTAPVSGNINTMPTVSPQRSATSSVQSNLTSPQRQYHSTQTSATDVPVRVTGGNTSSPNTANSSSITTSSLQRRGCAQKVTPIRPVPTGNVISASAPTGNTVPNQIYRSNLNQQNQIPPQPRILNKNAASATAGSGGPSNTTNASPMQRQRFVQPCSDTPQRMPQQHSQQQQQGSRSAGTVMNNQRIVTQQKLASNATTAVPRRPETTSTSTSSSTLDNYMSTLSQLTGGNTAVSITPAKPKEKAVIDLTDEDETPPAPPTIGSQQTNNVSVNQGQRRSLPAQGSNTNSNLPQYGRTPPLTRIPPGSQMANSNKSRQMAMQGQKNSSFSSTISTPPGTSITRINVAANTQGPQRVKYSHPAPLPATPPQAFNPSWKLPPPRPTIRISNLDNGIVISWTMEESMDRHAECVSYQIYAYQETSGPPMADSWRHVGDVKAMLLPMAVTLTQFQEGQRYFFAVRAVDCHQRYGPFSLPKTWS